jgi:subtilisin family serine protease
LIDADGDGLITFRDLNDAANAGFVTDRNGTGYIDAGDPLADASWADSSDTDGNGHVDDLVGCDTVDGDNDPMDEDGHGTFCSGILGAVGDNGVGMTDVNWQVRLMPMRFEPTVNNFLITNAAEALDYAGAMGATISSNSWGNGEFLQEMYDAIDRARTAGHLFVSSAGNWASDIDLPESPRYPAGYDLDNIIAVAAADKNDELADFSNWGLTNVDLAGPSPDILGPYLGNTYKLGGGTSSATPHVSGASALLRSVHPDWTATHIKDRILSTVDPLPSLVGKTVSGGRLNAAAAVAPPSITIDDVTLAEGDAGTVDAVFTVTLSEPSTDTVTVQFATADGTATAGSDYVAASATLEFSGGAVTQTITLQVNGDLDPEADETFFVDLTSLTNAILADSQGVGTIVDDDAQTVVFTSQDVPKNIADPNKGGKLRPANSQLLIDSTGITIDGVDIDVAIDHGSVGDLTASLKSPSGTEEPLAYGGGEWDLVNPSAFDGQPLDGTWVLKVTDNVRNGITGTLTAWSMTVTPLTEGAASQGEMLAAADLFFYDLGLGSEDESDKTDPLATQAADELALMLVE